MRLEVPAELQGTAGLWILLAVAIAVAVARRGRPIDAARIRPAALVTLAIQMGHCLEEWVAGFPRRFPEMLGLEPWSDPFFLLFNGFWLGCWAIAIAVLQRGRAPLPALAMLWFLGLAAVANGLVHPLMALATGGYFPGLATAIPLGVAGAVLVSRLTAEQTLR